MSQTNKVINDKILIGNTSSRKAGFTLAELIIAMAILAVVTAPILSVFVMSTRISATSYKMTIATFVAQQRMEELVGLTEADFKEMRESGTYRYITPLGSPTNEAPHYILELTNNLVDNGFTVAITVSFHNEIEIDDETTEYYPNLALATVIVYDGDGTSILCTQENYLNIAIGGV